MKEGFLTRRRNGAAAGRNDVFGFRCAVAPLREKTSFAPLTLAPIRLKIRTANPRNKACWRVV